MRILFKVSGRACISCLPDVVCRLVMIHIASCGASKPCVGDPLDTLGVQPEDGLPRSPAIVKQIDRSATALHSLRRPYSFHAAGSPGAASSFHVNADCSRHAEVATPETGAETQTSG